MVSTMQGLKVVVMDIDHETVGKHKAQIEGLVKKDVYEKIQRGVGPPFLSSVDPDQFGRISAERAGMRLISYTVQGLRLLVKASVRRPVYGVRGSRFAWNEEYHEWSTIKAHCAKYISEELWSLIENFSKTLAEAELKKGKLFQFLDRY
jgi:hypothetical protein